MARSRTRRLFVLSALTIAALAATGCAADGTRGTSQVTASGGLHFGGQCAGPDERVRFRTQTRSVSTSTWTDHAWSGWLECGGATSMTDLNAQVAGPSPNTQYEGGIQGGVDKFRSDNDHHGIFETLNDPNPNLILCVDTDSVINCDTPGAGTVHDTFATAVQTFYVDFTDGSDTNDGLSPATAWKTIGKVNSATLAAGSQVLFQRGEVWNSPGVALVVGATENGNAAQPIQFGAYGTGALPKITGGDSRNCIRSIGDHVVFERIEASSCTGSAGTSPGTGFNVFGQHTTVKDGKAAGSRIGVKLSNSADGHAQFSRVTGMVLDDNTANTTEGFGVLVNADNTDVDHNTITNQSTPDGAGGRSGSAVELFNASHVYVGYNNVEDSNGLSEVGRTQTTGDADDITFEYNRVHCDDATRCAEAGGFNIRGGNTNVRFLHNSVKVTTGNGEALVCYSGCPASTVMRDNVWVHTGVAGIASFIDGSGWTETGNVYQSATNPAAFVPHSSSVEGTMVFQPGVGNLRPAAGSLAVDRGSVVPSKYGAVDLDGNRVPLGSAPDSGAYEIAP